MPTRDRLLTVPNVLSLSRVVLAAAFVLVREPTARLVLVVVAALTDFLDGWLARHAGGSSRWGALIDPIGDRVFALVAVTAFLVEGQLSTLQYFVLLSRDIMTAIGFVVARLVSWLRPVEFKARYLGKVVTTLQLATLVVILLWPDWTTALVAMVGVASLASIADYTLALWRARARVA